MSYGYNQGGGYGGQRNPYDQRDDFEGANSGYGRLNDVEMQPFNPAANPPSAKDPNAILSECRDIDVELDRLDEQLQNLQKQFKKENENPQQVRADSESLMNTYRAMVSRVRKIKSMPDAGNPRNSPQIGKVDRRLKKAINTYQTMEREWRRDQQARREREYRIVKPDASEEEVRQAVEDPNAQIYKQALMSSNRLGQANTTLQMVQARHENIQKIERDMVELAQLFQDLNTIVVEQEEKVMDIEQKGEEVHENVVKGNEEIATAIVSARSRNRKKWWCLLICLIIIIIIVVAVVAYVLVNKKN